jgi:hypothetical protein
LQLIPLDLTILYAADSYPNKYWTAERNTTEWSVYMRELVRAGNQITQLELQALAPTMPGAHIGEGDVLPQSKTTHPQRWEPASFDSYGLFTDIYDHPGNYLNGTAPLNVTGCVNACVYELNKSTSNAVDCTVADGSAQDSFMWYVDPVHIHVLTVGSSFAARYDELHFSQQTARVIAREMATVMSGQFSTWATWLT